MNKKEISEIKRQFSPSQCSITRICGCYVDGEKNMKNEFREAFLSLQEEEMFKYFDILRKSLSGKIGNTLLNLEFPLDAEKEGGNQSSLLRLRSSRLKDQKMLDDFYNHVIDTYDYAGNYLILLIHNVYDIPGKSMDGQTIHDASEDVFEFIQCCICPVDLSKPGLSYNEQRGVFQNRMRDWVVGAPDVGFLFPAFNERAADIHNTLYFSRKADDIKPNFIEEVLGCKVPLESDCQRESFSSLVEELLGDKCSFERVQSIYESVVDKIEESKDIPEPLLFDKCQIKELFEACGVDDEELSRYGQLYDEIIGEKNMVFASNIVNDQALEILFPNVVVKIDSDHTGLVETREIGGRNYLLIGIEGEMEVGKIRTKVGGKNE